MPRHRKIRKARDGLPPPLTAGALERRLKVLRQWLETERAAIEFQDFVEPRRARMKARRSRAVEDAFAEFEARKERGIIKTLHQI